MWPDRVSNAGALTYESGALPTVLRGPAYCFEEQFYEGGNSSTIPPAYLILQWAVRSASKGAV